MPRVAEDRPPAEPTSREQKERYARILRAAARHGAAKGLERVQMHDIAKDAGVAIATLYRYFPSKTHLFTALMRSQVDQLAAMTVERVPDESPADGIARMLVRAGRELLRRPLLAHAMMQSNNATVAQTPSAGVTEVFIDVMLDAGGIADPTPHDLRLLGILEQAWYGMIISALNRGTDPQELEEDTALVVSLVVGARDAGSRTGDAA
ncbi:TetR/AcrR family transcriptional regulator [Nocardioides sp. IC4_145]|uniref:TetR family transcriptional regulator n=1 Tax=Nocardioides sp. IC4_145 TaxID=2714037 RepID=UPI00140B33F6|nr:TetR/AcrR family transcriptional regulator [Nocardioides sp. IC4_145]